MRSLAVLFAALAVPFVQGQTCNSLPNPLPQPSALPIIDTLPNPFTFWNGSALRSRADWACRRQELLAVVQNYMYGVYPDRSQETVSATRSGNTLTIRITAGGKTGQFTATLSLPSGASAQNPVPVVITTGGAQASVFTGSGVALATFSTGSVAADSSSKTGAFWSLYSGRDIGKAEIYIFGDAKRLQVMQVS